MINEGYTENESTDKTENTGYIPFSREFLDHPFYEKKPFDEMHAVLWLIAEARYKPGSVTKYLDGKPITWSRGQVPASYRYLMKAFGWNSISKVETWVNFLIKTGVVRKHTNQSQTVFEIIGYDRYSKSIHKQGHQNPQQERVSDDEQDTNKDSDRTVIRQRQDKTVNKVNKEKEGVNGNQLTPVINFKKLTEDEFQKSLVPYLEKYGKEMIRAFFDYWREPDEKGVMKFQREKTWLNSVRLATWYRRSQESHGNKNSIDKSTQFSLQTVNDSASLKNIEEQTKRQNGSSY